MNAECDSFLLGQVDCYRKVIRERCTLSAADEIENMLQTLVYNAKLSLVGRLGLCPVGKSKVKLYDIHRHLNELSCPLQTYT